MHKRTSALHNGVKKGYSPSQSQFNLRKLLKQFEKDDDDVL